MSTARLLDDVRAVMADRFPLVRYAGTERDGTVEVRPEVPPGRALAWYCRSIAQALTAAGYHATRSRTLVRVTWEPVPPRGAPDFASGRGP